MKTTVVAGAFGIFVGTTLVNFFSKIAQGPRPHLSIWLKDQQIAYGSRVQHHWQQLDDMTKPTGAPSRLQ